MIIYVITNKITGMKYVGQTTRSLEERFSAHCRRGNCRRIHNSIKKHGKENFIIEQIATASSLEELNELEKFWIKELNTLTPNGYNLKEGGKNGGSPSRETRAKISSSRKGNPLSEETRRKMSEAKKGNKNGIGNKSWKGKKIPKETVEKMSKAQEGNRKRAGKKHRPETIEKIRISMKRYLDKKRGLLNPIQLEILFGK